MSQQIKLTIPSDSKFLGLLRMVVEHYLTLHCVRKELVYKLIMSIDEACSNIIKHSYLGNKEQPIKLLLRFEGRTFKVELRDYGKQNDPSQFKPRPLDKIEPNGLGTHLINEIMDKVQYCIKRKRGTLLIMSRELKEEEFLASSAINHVD